MKSTRTLFVLIHFKTAGAGQMHTYYSLDRKEATRKAVELIGENQLYSLREFDGGFRMGTGSLPGWVEMETDPTLRPTQVLPSHTTRQTNPSRSSTNG